MNIPVQNLQTIPLKNQYIPTEGPKTIPLSLDFTVADTYQLDLSQDEKLGKIGYIQTIFVDLSGSDIALTFNIPAVQQKIVAKGRTQGYYPVLVNNPSVVTLTCVGGPAGVAIQLINVPIPGSVWPTQ